MAPAPRTRLNSAVGRGVDAMQSLPSPLAQVFQPLVVDDNMPETINSAAGPAGPISISYGPASRRRVSSMQSMKQWRHPESLINQAQANAMKKFPPKSSPVDQSALSESPGEGDSPLTEQKPPMDTAETANVGVPEWIKRIERMEKQQERIENLLVQIIKDIHKLGE